MPLRRLLCGAAATSAFLAVTQAADSSLTKQQLAGAARIDAITIPTPGEFFVSLDKQSQPNWTQLFHPCQPGATSSREQMALMLGVLVTDGYIAVEAQDGQGVKNVGKDIIGLAKKLNVSQSVLARGNSLNDFATNNDWSTLREELEATQNEVKLAMAEQKDQDLVALVTIGAWIRGMNVASTYLAANYSPGLAELLRQPNIATSLLQQLDKLPDKARQTPMLQSLRSGLESVRETVSSNAGKTLSEESIVKLSKITGAIVAAITEGSET